MLTIIKKILFSSTTKDTLVTFTGNGVVAVLGLVFTILVARRLGPGEFGVFSALIAIPIMLASLGDLGISNALVNFLPKAPQDRNLLVSMSIWLQFLISAVLAFGIVIIGAAFPQLIPQATFDQYLLTALILIVYIFSAFGASLARAEKKFILASVIQSLDSLAKLAVTFLLIYFFVLDTNTALIASLLGSLIASLLLIFLETNQLKPQFDRAKLREIFSYIKWVALMKIFSVAVARVDILLLNSLSSSYQAGLFAAASRVTLLFALLVSSLGGVVAPRFSSFSEISVAKKYILKLLMLVGGVAVVMLLTTLFSTQIVDLIFSEKYLEAATILRWMTVAMIPFLLTTVTVNPLLYTFNQPKFIAVVTIFQVVLIIGLDYLLIPQYQAMGPVISLGVSNFLVLMLTSLKLAQSFSQVK